MSYYVPNRNANPLVIYGFAIIWIQISLILEFYFVSLLGQSSIFFLFFPTIILSAWYGGIRAGLVFTFLTTLIILLLHSFSFQINFFQLTPTFLIQIGLYLLQGVMMSIILDEVAQNDLVGQFKRREKEQMREIEALQEKLELAKEEIKSRDEFLSIASHELKTPLTSMLLQLQSMLHNIKNVSLANFSVENLLKMLENAENQTQRLSKMINDLLNVSLITTKKLDLEFEEVDLSALTKEVVENFLPKLEREGQTLRLEANGAVVGTWDKLRIEQVITNLITNAIKYGDKKPIEVKIVNTNGTGKIIVQDHGIGIPKNQQEKIFVLFERANSSSKYKGLGVGLYITNQIVKAHHGEIRVESRENEGSTFIVELPIKKANA